MTEQEVCEQTEEEEEEEPREEIGDAELMCDRQVSSW